MQNRYQPTRSEKSTHILRRQLYIKKTYFQQVCYKRDDKHKEAHKQYKQPHIYLTSSHCLL